jgi:hypothetical protein
MASLCVLRPTKQDERRQSLRLPPSSAPFGGKKFGLGENGLDGFALEIRQIVVFSKDGFDQDFDLGAGAFAQSPIEDGDTLRTWVTDAAAMTLSSSLPLALTALLLPASASKNRATGRGREMDKRNAGRTRLSGLT